jgi:hypothetical protein
MTKKRRTAHIPQGAPRKRRPVRRAFEGVPVAEPRTDAEGNPIFADDAVAPDGLSGYGGSSPVETRPHWIGSSDPEQTPARRRRLEQLRRSGGDMCGVRIAAGQLPTYERSYLVSELRRIGITSGLLLTLIIVLAIVLR